MASPLGAQTRVDSLGFRPSVDEVHPEVQLRLDRIVRIGGVEGEPDRILASGGSLARDMVHEEGFFLDALDHRVKVFSNGGDFLRAWGREGEGPGEFEGAMGIAYARDTVLGSDGTRVHAFDLPGFRIVSNLGVVRGIVVRSRSVFGTFGAGIQTLFGGNISLFTELAERTRQQAFETMLVQADVAGADAVIGIRYDATEVMSGVTEVICYGTAVTVEPLED